MSKCTDMRSTGQDRIGQDRTKTKERDNEGVGE